MKFSKEWLQSYIEEALPDDKVIDDILSKKAFELEGVENFKYSKVESSNSSDNLESIIEDTVYDIKVLPNRHGDALSHYFMAKELCALFGFSLKPAFTPNPASPLVHLQRGEGQMLGGSDFVKIENANDCPVFETVRISGVDNRESPEWMKRRLAAIGQKSINAIVDVTNYVQFAINKPLHSYDARNVKGGFIIRRARAGEKLMTLTGTTLDLDTDTLVIADQDNTLGLAGIKGGLASGVNDDTKDIIIESANFKSILIRKTSKKYNLRTDASKRFEAGQSDMLVPLGIDMAITLYKEIFGDNIVIGDRCRAGKISSWQYKVGVSLKEINEALGTSYNNKIIESTLNKYNFKYKKTTLANAMQYHYEELLGKPYQRDTSMRDDAPEKFSCSSLVSYLYLLGGVYMPSTVIDKYKFAKVIEESEVKPYDVIFLNSKVGIFRHETTDYMRGVKVLEDVDHVGIIFPNGEVLHASRYLNSSILAEKNKKESVENDLRFGAVGIESIEEIKNKFEIVSYGRFADASEERYVIDISHERVDLRLPVDIIEEIGRNIGYDDLSPVMPQLNRVGRFDNRTYIEMKCREYLSQNGYDETMTYTLKEIDQKVENKSILESLTEIESSGAALVLRHDLSTGLIGSYSKSLANAPLMELNVIRSYEIGSVFKDKVEERHLAIVCDDSKKKTKYKEELESLVKGLAAHLGLEKVEYEWKSEKPAVVEIDLNTTPFARPQAEGVNLNIDHKKEFKYKHLSPFPIVTRDVACFYPEGLNVEKLAKIIAQNTTPFPRPLPQGAGEEMQDAFKAPLGELPVGLRGLAKKFYLVDQFDKTMEDGTVKHSAAFRIVYQSDDRTLTDEEVNVEVAKVYDAMKAVGCELR